MMLCDDFCFHFMHRLFHSKNQLLPLYQMFHKQHHEFNETVSIAAEYAHPVEFALCNLLPLFSGLFVLRSKCHFITFVFFGTFKLPFDYEEAERVSGQLALGTCRIFMPRFLGARWGDFFTWRIR